MSKKQSRSSHVCPSEQTNQAKKNTLGYVRFGLKADKLMGTERMSALGRKQPLGQP